MTDTQSTTGPKTREASEKTPKFGIDHRTGKLVVGSLRIPLPKSKVARISIGLALMAGGFLGFLPVLGFWMVPLGVVVLSQDLPMARRLSRRASVAWMRWRRSRGKGQH